MPEILKKSSELLDYNVWKNIKHYGEWGHMDYSKTFNRTPCHFETIVNKDLLTAKAVIKNLFTVIIIIIIIIIITIIQIL